MAWYQRDHLFSTRLGVLAVSLAVTPHLIAQDAEKFFFQRQNVMLLEVLKVKENDEKNSAKDGLKMIRLVVKVKAILPPSNLLGKQREIAVIHEESVIKFGRGQDWFPTEVGKQIVTAFNGKEIPAGDELEPLLTGYPSETSWYDCIAFYDAINRPRNERTAALTKTLQDQPQRLSPIFFHLLHDYNGGTVGDTAFATAAAAYLRNPVVSLADRCDILCDLNWTGVHNPTANRRMLSAALDLALEAKKMNAHPGTIGNVFSQLCVAFVVGKSVADLPNVETSIRQKLLPLVRDKTIVHDQRSATPLVRWLEGKAPGDIPFSSREEEMKLMGQIIQKRLQPVPRQKDLQPKTVATAEAGSLSWLKVFAIIAGFLGGLTLLLAIIVMLRKRRASP